MQHHSKPMYECVAFFPGTHPKKWKYVRNLQTFERFLRKEHASWKYMNVYDKNSKKFLRRIYPNP